MKYSAVIFLSMMLSFAVFPQKTRTAKNTKPPARTNLVVTEKPGDEKEEFERAAATANAAERVMALQKFVAYFPQSEKKFEAQELIAVARVAAADEKLRAGENESGTELFKLAVKDAPVPFSDKLFTEIILQIPTNLFWRGQQKAALEIAQLVEAKTDGNAKQTIALATFYIGIENAAETERLARKAIASDANMPAAYQTLGLAHRINFQLDEAASAYQKALELDPASSVSKRSLAEMKRAAGKPDEAAALYREILAAEASDAAAQTGLILALFDNGKRAEAETEMRRSLEANPNNLSLLVGAAYWYAASGDGAKSVELASKAVEIEPRYTWAHVALARGFVQQKRPLEAERTLLAARQFGNFPTLDYEIASARFRAGFFREAAETLRQSFAVKGDVVETRLGGRVSRESSDFIELLAPERRASIFQPTAADDRETAEKLKSLFVLTQKLDAANADEAEIGNAADRFVEGDDAMRLHRQLYVASRLLQIGKALPKTLEIAQSALGKTDAALDVPTASAAVLADELYESRALAVNRNQVIVVPEVPRQTLSAILRGRIEEIAGWTLYQQNNPSQAVVRLKRAVSVLPDGSAWWRSSMWRLGAALQADGKEKEALDAYLKSYPKDLLDGAKYGLVESLYQKVNGSLEGFEARIGAQSAPPVVAQPEIKPAETVAQNEVRTEAAAEPKPTAFRSTKPVKIPDNVPLMATAAEPASPKQPAITPQPEITKEIAVNTEKSPEIETPEISPKVESPKANVSTGIKNFNQTRNPVAQKISDSVKNSDPAAKNSAAAENKPAAEIAADGSTASENTPNEPAQTKQDQLISKEITVPEVKTENAPKTVSAESAEPKPGTESNDKSIKAKTVSASPGAAKSLFEPIVISVPQREPLKIDNSESSASKAATEEKLLQIEKPGAVAAEDKSETKQTPLIPAETVAADNSPLTRPRVIITDNLPPEKIVPCTIVSNEESISLLNGGGVLGVLIGFRGGKGDLMQLLARSSSPDDVEVLFEPEIIAPAGRAFYVVKSVSSKTGVFTVTFEAPCGKKEMSVTVR